MNSMLYIPPDRAPLGESRIPDDFNLDTGNLNLSYYLTTVTPAAIQISIAECRDAAQTAIRSMRKLNDLRQLHFAAPCPKDDMSRSIRHADAIRQLKAWRENYSTTDPNIAPSMEIPRLAMEGLCVSRAAYARYTCTYDEFLREYMDGPYKDYEAAKRDVILAIQDERTKNSFTGTPLRLLLEFKKEFMKDMGKWEPFVQHLALPTYEEVVGHLFGAVMQCVEGADKLLAEMSNAAPMS